jgi:hypothetical protein
LFFLSVEAIGELFLHQLRWFGEVGIAVEGVFAVETVPVLCPVVIALQNWVRLPSLPVEVGVVGRVAAALGRRLLRLQKLLSGTVGRTEQFCRVFEGLASGGSPLRLSGGRLTFQPGWARWISLLPYLLLEATLERSISASLFKLSPVEAIPK